MAQKIKNYNTKISCNTIRQIGEECYLVKEEWDNTRNHLRIYCEKAVVQNTYFKNHTWRCILSSENFSLNIPQASQNLFWIKDYPSETHAESRARNYAISLMD